MMVDACKQSLTIHVDVQPGEEDVPLPVRRRGKPNRGRSSGVALLTGRQERWRRPGIPFGQPEARSSQDSPLPLQGKPFPQRPVCCCRNSTYMRLVCFQMLQMPQQAHSSES